MAFVLNRNRYKHCPICGKALLDLQAEALKPRSCEDPLCSFIDYDSPVPVVAAIVTQGEEVILVRSHGWPEKMFGLVAGFLEKNETPKDGVLREVHEELGVTGQVKGLIGHYPFAEMNQIIIVYEITIEGSIALGEELSAYKMIPIAKLRPWTFGTGPAVQDWLDKKFGQES